MPNARRPRRPSVGFASRKRGRFHLGGSRRLPSVVVGLIVALVAGACAAPAQGKIGGHVSVMGSWSGVEETSFLAMVEPFEARTGITVDYTSTRDLNGLLWRGVARHELPDVAGLPGPGQMAEFARIGALKDLGKIIDVPHYKAETVPAFVELGSVDDRLVGVFIKSTLKGLIWYNPRVYTLPPPTTWEELQRGAALAARSGTRTWCVGLESGESSGWPGTDWIEDIVLRQSGPQVYDDWVAGRLRWTSQPIRQAFETFGWVVAPGNVFGGAETALATNFTDASTPMFADPPGCLFHHQASFMTQFFTSESAARQGEFDFFPFPTIDPRFAGSVVGAGDLLGIFNDTPQARALLRYLVTEEAQTIWVQHGGVLSVNTKVVDYPDPISARAAATLRDATRFRFDASDLMPEAMNAAFWRAVLDFTRDQSRLDEILERLDGVRTKAYGNA